MSEIQVRCGCGRTMSPAAFGGQAAFRCGCGAGITVVGLPKSDAGHCAVPIGGRTCNGPKERDELTCQPCAVKITRNAVLNPETAEQIAAHLERGEFLAARHRERERLLEESQAKLQEARDRGPRRDRARRAEVVYYCLIRPGVVKIGTTAQLYVRMESFRVADGAVLAAEPGSFPLEGMRHKQFAHLRIDGLGRREDFRLDDQMQSHIDMLVAMYGQPFDLVEALLDRQSDLAEVTS